MDSMEGFLRANELELKYRIEAETFSGRKFSRVRFAHGLLEKPHVVERKIQLRGVRNGTEQCFEETAFVKVCSLVRCCLTCFWFAHVFHVEFIDLGERRPWKKLLINIDYVCRRGRETFNRP